MCSNDRNADECPATTVTGMRVQTEFDRRNGYDCSGEVKFRYTGRYESDRLVR